MIFTCVFDLLVTDEAIERVFVDLDLGHFRFFFFLMITKLFTVGFVSHYC